jgi:hypothetical protein
MMKVSNLDLEAAAYHPRDAQDRACIGAGLRLMPL